MFFFPLRLPFLQFVLILYFCLLEFVSHFSKASIVHRPSSIASQKTSFPLYSLLLFDSSLFCFEFFCCFLPLALTRNSWSRFRPREMFSFILDLFINKRDFMKASNSCGAIAGIRTLSFFLEYLLFARMSVRVNIFR